jgi:hypothetical protein
MIRASHASRDGISLMSVYGIMVEAKGKPAV